jgi:type II secretory pathway component GspD/PulD (secretin)
MRHFQSGFTGFDSMNLTACSLAVMLSVCMALSVCAEESITNNLPPASHPINFRKVSVLEVLKIYRNVTQTHLTIAADVLQEKRTITLTATAHSPAEVAKLIQEALSKQADILITPHGGKNASVTLKKSGDQS